MTGAFMRIGKYLGTDLCRGGMSISNYGGFGGNTYTPSESPALRVEGVDRGQQLYTPYFCPGGGGLFEYVYADLKSKFELIELIIITEFFGNISHTISIGTSNIDKVIVMSCEKYPGYVESY